MSDYWPEQRFDTFDLPLFSAASAVKQARTFHERDEAQASVLATLRTREALTKMAYESRVANGSRLAPVIEQLRNAHGFKIDGDGSIEAPYILVDVSQKPTLVRVTPQMKAAYYMTPHWNKVRMERRARDMSQCVLCSATSDLQCHHVSYDRLFAEPLEDLLTLCSRCHERVHEHCRQKFPSGIAVQYASHLGWKGFEPWLM
jgi:uncharacterized protein YlaI